MHDRSPLRRRSVKGRFPKRWSPRLETLEARTLLSTWYVAPGGSDAASGALGNPFQTIQYALDRAAAGDVIALRGGTYNLTKSLFVNTSDLTVQSYSGERAHIVAPTTNSGIVNVLNVGASNNTHLLNLDISGGYYYAVKVDGGDNLLISNCTLHDTGADVVKLTPGSDNSVIENSEIYNSGRRDGSNAEGVDAVGADNATLRDSYIHDTATNAVYYKGGSTGTLIERNRITRAGYSGILLGQSTDKRLIDNPDRYESIDAIARNNIVWDVEGAGIGAWGALRPQILNNTLSNVAKSMFGGLLVQAEGSRSSTDVTLYNNVVTVPSNRAVLNVRAGGLTGYLQTDNNYFHTAGGTALIVDAVHGYTGNLAGWQGLGYDTHSYAGDPALDAGNGYHLLSTSPAIDRGRALANVGDDIDRDSRPANAGYDIGADEVQGVVTPPPIYTPAWQNATFAPQTGRFTVDFDATPAMANMDMTIGISSGATTSLGDLAASVRFSNGGTIVAHNGGSDAAMATLYYTPGTTYHIRFTIDLASKTYDAVVTSGATSTTIASGYAFRSEAATVTVLSNRASYNATGDATMTAPVVATVTSEPGAFTPAWTNSAFARQSRKFSIEFTATPAMDNMNMVMGLSRSATTIERDLAAVVRFNSSGTIDVRNGGVYAADAVVGYTAGTPYTIRMVVDLATKRYDVYVTTGGTTTQIATNYAFRTEQARQKFLGNRATYNFTGNATLTQSVLAPVA